MVNREDIIRMAKQAAEETGTLVPTEWNDPLLERFHAIAVAAEREACAELCEEMEDRDNPYERNVAVLDCASAIRARGET